MATVTATWSALVSYVGGAGPFVVVGVLCSIAVVAVGYVYRRHRAQAEKYGVASLLSNFVEDPLLNPPKARSGKKKNNKKTDNKNYSKKN